MSWENLKEVDNQEKSLCRVLCENTGDEVVIRLYNGTDASRVAVANYLLHQIETDFTTSAVKLADPED